jgi:hypothetical protein
MLLVPDAGHHRTAPPLARLEAEVMAGGAR